MLRVLKLIMSIKCIYDKDNVHLVARLSHKKSCGRKQNTFLIFSGSRHACALVLALKKKKIMFLIVRVFFLAIFNLGCNPNNTDFTSKMFSLKKFSFFHFFLYKFRL